MFYTICKLPFEAEGKDTYVFVTFLRYFVLIFRFCEVIQSKEYIAKYSNFLPVSVPICGVDEKRLDGKQKNMYSNL